MVQKFHAVACSEPRVTGDLNTTSGIATIYPLQLPIILPQGIRAPPFLAIPRGLWRNMAWKHKSQIVQQLNQCFPRARKKDRMLSCRMNQIQWTLRKAGRHRGFEDGLAVTMTSTHLEAILILSSEPSALFLFRIRILSFSLIFHPFQFLPGRTVEGRSVREPHDVRFPSFPLPRMRESQPPDISGKLSPASIHSIEHTRKKWPSSFWKRSLRRCNVLKRSLTFWPFKGGDTDK